MLFSKSSLIPHLSLMDQWKIYSRDQGHPFDFDSAITKLKLVSARCH